MQDPGSLRNWAKILIKCACCIVQDPGSLDPLATALARASGSSQRALDQIPRHGSNTSLASLAGSTASSLIPPPGGGRSHQPHSHSAHPGGSAAPLSEQGSYEAPLRSHSGPLTSAAQMSHPAGGSERGAMQYAGGPDPSTRVSLVDLKCGMLACCLLNEVTSWEGPLQACREWGGGGGGGGGIFASCPSVQVRQAWGILPQGELDAS